MSICGELYNEGYRDGVLAVFKKLEKRKTIVRDHYEDDEHIVVLYDDIEDIKREFIKEDDDGT